ncbi:MAG: TetR/AcrR family transcriptional regulator [Peptococcaceae bacterium]|nr:TetR/AcrR family transcriptional regulator [Peptococcaceae bacterium]
MNRTRQRKEPQTPVMKSLILEKAGLLFWQKGYNNTSMKDIANACECKPANFYNYFSGKEDILYEVVKDITEKSISSIRHLADDEETNPMEQLRIFIKNHFNLHINLEQTSVMLSDTGIRHLSQEHRDEIIRMRDIYENTLLRIIRRGKEAGIFASYIDEKIISYNIPSMIIRSSIWYSAKGRLSLEEVSEIMFDFTLHGIRDRTDISSFAGN